MIKRVELFRNVRQLVRFQVNKIQISVIDTNMDIQFTYWLRQMQCRFVSCNTCLSGSMLPMITSVFRALLNELWRYTIFHLVPQLLFFFRLFYTRLRFVIYAIFVLITTQLPNYCDFASLNDNHRKSGSQRYYRVNVSPVWSLLIPCERSIKWSITRMLKVTKDSGFF